MGQSTQDELDKKVIELFEINLFDLIDQDIVSATQEKQSILDAPAQAYIITQEQIQLRGYRSLLEVLDDIPQFMILKNSDPESKNLLTVRGITGNEKLLILKDGIRITPATGDFYSFSSNFNVLNAQRIEVILGPASALYGVDAYSGIVQIITKKEDQHTVASLRTQTGRFGDQTLALDLGMGNSEVYFQLSGHVQQSNEPDYTQFYPELYGWYLEAFQPHGWVMANPESGIVYNIDQYRYEAGDSYYGDPVSREFSLYSTSSSLDATLFFKEFTFSFNQLTESHNSSYGLDPRFTAFDQEARITTRQNVLAGSHWYRSFDHSLDIKTTLSFNFFELDPTSHVVNLNSLYQRGYLYSYSNTARVEQQANWKVSPKVKMTFGHSFEQHASLPRSALSPVPYDKNLTLGEQSLYYIGAAGYLPYAYRALTDGPIDITGVQEVPVIYQDSLTKPQIFYFNRFTNYGGYAQSIVKPMFGLDVILGARYDYNSRYGATFNPRVGYVWRLTERTILKMMYGTSFLSPSPSKAFKQFGSFEGSIETELDDEYFGSVLYANTFHFPNPELKPERLRSFDVGFTTFLNDQLSIQYNGFYSVLIDGINLFANAERQLTDDFFTEVATQSQNNSTQTNIRGMTLSGNYFIKLGDWQYRFDLAYDHVHGKSGFQVDYNQLSYYPEHAWKTSFSMENQRFSSFFRLIHRSELLNNPDAKFVRNAPASWSLNGNVHAIILDKSQYQARLFITGYNLLNQRYGYVSILKDAAIPFTPQDPISWQLGLQIDMK